MSVLEGGGGDVRRDRSTFLSKRIDEKKKWKKGLARGVMSEEERCEKKEGKVRGNDARGH